MKKIICIVLVITLIISVAVGLADFPKSNSAKNETQLTYYTVKNSGFSFDDIVKYYNDSAKKAYKIKIVEFKDTKEMYSRMSTEIMSGGGPDLFNTEHCLPFEKMAEAGAFMDIDRLLESQENTIDFSDLNKAVMDAGVFNGKRYILPLFYRTGTVISLKDTLKKFHMPTKNGYTPTYNNLDIFDNVLSCDENYFIFCGDGGEYSYNGRERFFRFIDSYIDMEKKTTEFNTEEFKRNAEKMKKLATHNNGKDIPVEEFFCNYLFQYWQSGLIDYAFNAENNVFYKDFSRNSKDNIGYIETAVAINRNTKQPEKICRFLEYALGNFLQVKVGSDRASVHTYPGLLDLSFPVKKSSFDVCVRYTSEYEDLYTGISPGIDNEFMREYIKTAKNVTKCKLYPYIQHSYYSSKVINEIVYDYLNDEISTEKFISQLNNATWIYMEE
ncbi:MAG: ABC transporter substrate-binding protein [Ruminococcus sp.]